MFAVMRAIPAVIGVICLALATSGTPSLAAKIYPWGGKSGTDYIEVEGEIVKSDLERLQRVYQGVRPTAGPGMIIGFDSPGGDLSEAMAMGRWIRQTKAKTGVAPHSSCASACVYAFAGGVDKYLAGELLIHRPFLATNPARPRR